MKQNAMRRLSIQFSSKYSRRCPNTKPNQTHSMSFESEFIFGFSNFELSLLSNFRQKAKCSDREKYFASSKYRKIKRFIESEVNYCNRNKKKRTNDFIELFNSTKLTFHL